MLAGVLTLHDPSCSVECRPAYCIADVEKLARSVISAHERAGSKRSGRLDRPGMTLTASDREDLLAHLIAEAWRASQRFRPDDDGRGTNRLAGYVVKTLHFRLVDWVRATKGSTRYPNSRIVATLVPLTPSIEERLTPFLDPEHDDSPALDLEAAPVGTREALELIQPLLDGEPLTQAQLAVRGGVPAGQVQKAVRLVREEAIRQGLRRVPSDTIRTVVVHV
jgi:DNA-directed RNA polymerase specialized sigma24 family protein